LLSQTMKDPRFGVLAKKETISSSLINQIH
jgi:hypothetical protein